MDFERHNAEIKQVWDRYRAGQPIRPPMVLGINTRYTLFDREANPRGVTFEQYFADPDAMLTYQLEHQHFVRHNVVQDAEMGLPKDGWSVWVDLQNVYEAAWLGCPVRFYADQVPDTEPILSDDASKRSIFGRGVPDPCGGFLAKNIAFYEHWKKRRAEGYTFRGLPLKDVGLGGMGTDGPLTVACNLRGTTEMMTDLVDDPEYARELLDFITTATIARIKAYRAIVGLPEQQGEFWFADDSLQLVSTRMYEEMILPMHQRLVRELSGGAHVGIHLCGDSTRHFKFLCDRLGVKSFDTGFPVDFAWVREAVGPDVQIQGGPRVALLLQATEGEVRNEVRRILASGVCRGGKFVLREGNNLAPNTPRANLAAMYEACKEFGTQL
jgi:hypothetical protein